MLHETFVWMGKWGGGGGGGSATPWTAIRFTVSLLLLFAFAGFLMFSDISPKGQEVQLLIPIGASAVYPTLILVMRSVDQRCLLLQLLLFLSLVQS